MISIHESPKFVIQQTLHGYSDGHRLVASSCRLTRDVENLMLILSDLSGSGGGDQFDPYLTGYPLESTGRYALACTWPAPEMKRPGCVWTHTLLLGEELLAEMNNPEEFLTLFNRPHGSSNFSEYFGGMQVPELFGAREHRTSLADDWTVCLGPHLSRAFYGTTSPFAVLVVPRYAAAEMPILSAWRLQWPSLRARFSFCSGALNVRTVEGSPMNLQAALNRDVRRLDRGVEPPSLFTAELPPLVDTEEWEKVAATAWSAPDSHNLVGFFNRLGCDLPGDPALFRPVATVFSTLCHSTNPLAVARELVSYIAEEFPAATMGVEFKRAVLGLNSVTKLSEIAVLQALAETEKCDSFEPISLQIQSRSAALWGMRDVAWRLMSRLLAGLNTPLSEKVLTGLIDGMPTDALFDALDTGGEVLEGFVRRNPSIAGSWMYWSPPAQRQTNAARALAAAVGSVNELIPQIVTAALDANADPVDPGLMDVLGDGAVPVVLEWLDDDGTRASQLPNGWKASLRRKPAQMLAWLNARELVREETARFILSANDVTTAFPSRELTAVLTRFLPVIDAAEVEHSARIGCSALKVAMGTASPSGEELAAACLDVVYHAALRSRVPDDAWWKLSSELPRSYPWQDWDRCQRIRKGVIERFISAQWRASSLLTLSNDRTLFSDLVAELRSSKSGKKILKEVKGSAEGWKRDIITGN